MARVIGASLLGVDGVAVEVEVRLSSQLPRIDIVGLPEAAVRESAARVRAAIASIGQRFPDRRITVNRWISRSRSESSQRRERWIRNASRRSACWVNSRSTAVSDL